MESGSIKIMIAEDSSVIQNLTSKILQIQNYAIKSVKNGKQVLKSLEKDDYDLILMDINMPIMNGIECAREIRKLKDKKKNAIPIIAITGNADNYTLEQFRNAGINDFIPKPLNYDFLVDVVKKYITNGG
ncbi:MAG TPA: response regulator [Cyclobacteriaceae bacterium]